MLDQYKDKTTPHLTFKHLKIKFWYEIRTYIHVTEKTCFRKIFPKEKILWKNPGKDSKSSTYRHLDFGDVAYHYDTAEEKVKVF